MRCPKCGHEQPEAPECTSCGIIVEKFIKLQAAREAAEVQARVGEPDAGSPWPRRLAGIAAVAGLIGAGYALLGDRQTPEPIATGGTPTTVAVRPPAVPVATEETSGDEAAETNPVEDAREATVTIRTPWGLGSGFFANDRCDIVTNRHVIALSDAQHDRADDQLGEHEERLDELRGELDARKQDFLARCSDCSEESYQEHVGQYEAKYAAIRARVAQGRENLHTVVAGRDLVVVTVDDEEYEAEVGLVSETLDLAVLRSGAPECYWLDAGDESALSPGDRLYAIGSPLGLGHSVTSGVFSGVRDLGDARLLQTDTPINPGNSGGPLVDESGEVVGVNTLTAANADGIGFAIPFSAAVSALGLQ